MKFVESVHRYIHDGADYTPVTSFLKYFQEYVDWDKKAEEKAAKLGIPKQELQAQWNATRDAASDRGTKYHKMMEDLVSNQGIVTIDDTECNVIYTPERDGIKEDQKVELDNNTLYAEKMIWSYRYKICGTADIVEVVDGKVNIKDYKTNAKLDMKGWYNPKTKKTKKLLGPLRHLDDCKFNIYQLQINIYMYMFLQHNRNLKLGKMEILHIILDTEGNEIDRVVHKVANLQKEVKTMFEHYKERKKK